MAFMAIIMGLGLIFYILLGFRWTLKLKTLDPLLHTTGLILGGRPWKSVY